MSKISKIQKQPFYFLNNLKNTGSVYTVAVPVCKAKFRRDANVNDTNQNVLNKHKYYGDEDGGYLFR